MRMARCPLDFIHIVCIFRSGLFPSSPSRVRMDAMHAREGASFQTRPTPLSMHVIKSKAPGRSPSRVEHQVKIENLTLGGNREMH